MVSMTARLFSEEELRFGLYLSEIGVHFIITKHVHEAGGKRRPLLDLGGSHHSQG